MPDLPSREFRDPKALRAMAHPVRLLLMEELFLSGPATATELAERVGESPANCSWHLRQLAAYGFVEEAGGGIGRKRPWRAVLRENRWGDSDESPELALAGEAAAEILMDREYSMLWEWQATRREAEPPAWQDAAFLDQAMGWLTAEELNELASDIHQLLMRYIHRFAEPASRPAGSRPVRFVAWGVPARPYGNAALNGGAAQSDGNAPPDRDAGSERNGGPEGKAEPDSNARPDRNARPYGKERGDA